MNQLGDVFQDHNNIILCEFSVMINIRSDLAFTGNSDCGILCNKARNEDCITDVDMAVAVDIAELILRRRSDRYRIVCQELVALFICDYAAILFALERLVVDVDLILCAFRILPRFAIVLGVLPEVIQGIFAGSERIEGGFIIEIDLCMFGSASMTIVS